MIDMQEHSPTHKLIYVPADEKKTLKRLFAIRDADAVYRKKGLVIGAHWILHNLTVGKLFRKHK